MKINSGGMVVELDETDYIIYQKIKKVKTTNKI